MQKKKNPFKKLHKIVAKHTTNAIQSIKLLHVTCLGRLQKCNWLVRGHSWYCVVRHASTWVIYIVFLPPKLRMSIDEVTDMVNKSTGRNSPKQKQLKKQSQHGLEMWQVFCLYRLLYTVVLTLSITTSVEWHWHILHNCKRPLVFGGWHKFRVQRV